MTISSINIGVINYPGAMQSAIHGFTEMFTLANDIAADAGINKRIHLTLIDVNPLPTPHKLQALIIPPVLEKQQYLNVDPSFQQWIIKQHAKGTTLCASCAGTFVIASTGLLDQRPATTHWDLAHQFHQSFPDIRLDIDKILVNDGDIITAGGLMSWIDLGLELVAQFIQPSLMRQLGQYMVVDTGLREQRYYQRFNPVLDHGDKTIVKAQHFIHKHFDQSITIESLCSLCCLSERTFLRHFVKATTLKPTQYIQQIRIRKACELIESSTSTFETIAATVGYEDSSAFRKTFVKIIGLTPREFKQRFVSC